MAEVVLRNVKKIYRLRQKKKEDVLAVKNLNLTIEDGEFLALCVYRDAEKPRPTLQTLWAWKASPKAKSD